MRRRYRLGPLSANTLGIILVRGSDGFWIMISPLTIYAQRIKCALLETSWSSAPAPALKLDIDNSAGNNNQGNPSGADISFSNDFHTASYAPPNASSNKYTKLPTQPTVRIYCQANNDLSVTAGNGFVVLEPANSNDNNQVVNQLIKPDTEK